MRYYQWDDWAPLNWEWPPRAFQDGASHWMGVDPMNASRPMPLSLYNGEWNGGQHIRSLSKFRWDCGGTDPTACLATDPEFFKAILANGSKAGMVMFEQDYICSTTGQTARRLGAGPEWFEALDTAAVGAGVDVQRASA